MLTNTYSDRLTTRRPRIVSVQLSELQPETNEWCWGGKYEDICPGSDGPQPHLLLQVGSPTPPAPIPCQSPRSLDRNSEDDWKERKPPAQGSRSHPVRYDPEKPGWAERGQSQEAASSHLSYPCTGQAPEAQWHCKNCPRHSPRPGHGTSQPPVPKSLPLMGTTLWYPLRVPPWVHTNRARPRDIVSV